jgi:RNA polymerase sigma-70 factor (ECF subfamily)
VNNQLPDDNSLAARVANGDTALYRILMQRHTRQVHAMGVSFLKNAEEANDFSQEVFIKAFNNIKQFTGSSRFSTWLYRIAYNTAINSVNRRKEYVSLAENDDTPSSNLSPEEATIKDAVRAAVRQAVNELPEKQKACIDLFFFYDRSYAEIQEITGDPVNTIKSHVFRAKKLLRDKLRDLQ